MKKQIEKISLENFGIVLLFLFPIIASVYYALALPVSFDEAATFLLFTNKGFIATTTHYPAPNNHVLHSVITNFTKQIPYLSSLFKLRISSVFINIGALIVLYKFVANHYNKKMALIVVAISSMLFLNIYYSYMSRGYALVNLFFIASLYCSFNIVKGENTTKNWLLFSIFSIFGFYTMPSYLYPFLTLNCFLFVYQSKNIWKQLFSNAAITLVVFLLYLPIIYNEGLSAITNNPYVQPIGFVNTVKSLPLFYLKTIQEITGIHWIVICLLLCVSFYFIVKSQNKMNLYFSILFITAPIILLSAHCVIPYSRIFNYYGFIIVLLIFLPFAAKIDTLKLRSLIPVLLLIQIFLLLNFESKIYAYEDRDLALNITGDKIISRIAGNKKHLFNNSLLSYNLEFQLISKGYKNYQIKEVDYKKISADSISDFDFIIIKKEEDYTKNKKALFITAYYNVYEN